MAAAQALLKRNKRQVAVSVKDECSRIGAKPKLEELLNYLLDPEQAIDRFDTVDWCRWLISGGTTFDEFAKTVKKYDHAVKCGLVWTQDFVAYRCRTCAISPCMSLCADCFQSSDHTGHDYNMFRSAAGGACDCGDVSVMRPDGFCGRHGPKNNSECVSVPPELLCVAKTMMPRLLFRFIQHFRYIFSPEFTEESTSSTQERSTRVQAGFAQAEQFINFLHQLTDMGAAMRDVIAATLTDTHIYATLTKCDSSSSEYHVRSTACHKVACESLPTPSMPQEFSDVTYINAPLVHASLLQELLFWNIKLEFPANLVTFLLSLLPNLQYKEAFTDSFVQHYSRICCSLIQCTDRSKTANRVVHVSVQLLSPEELAERMVHQLKILHIMVTCLRHIVENRLTTCGLHECSHASTLVVDCSRDVFKEHCYWPIVSDLINILSHKDVAHAFLEDENLLIFWFELLAYFQGMNVNSRLLHDHIEYEPDTYYAAFSAELEICASTMWSLLVHCTSMDFKDFTHGATLVITKVLKDWLESVGVTPFSKPQPLRGSFHLPLHRHLAMFLSTAVRHHGATLSELLPKPDVLQMIMTHPLQLQVMFHEVFAGMWVRNGLQIRGQAMTYVQCHFCNSMVDADLYLLQVCGASLDPDYFVKTVLERFHVMDLLTFAPQDGVSRLGFIELDKQMPMLEACLSMLTLIIALRTHTGQLEGTDITRKELVTLLCTADHTHSQLKELLPEKCGISQHAVPKFEEILKEISDYKAPVFEPGGTMQSGIYKPKPQIWEEEFDPLYVMLRSMYKKDLQNSMDRFTSHVKQRKLYTGNTTPWPPFRTPTPLGPQYTGLSKLLHCRTTHALLFSLLYKCVHESNVTEAVAYFTVYLLELTLTIPHPRPRTHKTSSSYVDSRRDKQLSSWYGSDHIDVNARELVDHVTVTVTSIDEERSCPTPKLRPHSPDETLFDLAPSQMSTSQGLMTSLSGDTSSAVINAVQALLEETVNQEEGGGASTSTSASTSSRMRTMGVSANIESHFKNVNVKVGESMISLLLKLREKFSTNKSHYMPKENIATVIGTKTELPMSDKRDNCDKYGGARQKYTKQSTADTEMDTSATASTSKANPSPANSRIGDGALFIDQVLDKLCESSEENKALVRSLCDTAHTKTQADRAAAKLEQRKRKAKARQERLMAEFAQKQAQFAEKHAEQLESEASDLGDTEMQHAPSQTFYDCVICNQSTASTHENPVALVGLLQATNVLGFRTREKEARILAVGTNSAMQHSQTYSTHYNARIQALTTNFAEASVLNSEYMLTEGNVHMQTCGHHVHLSCHKAYVTSLRSEQHHSFTLLHQNNDFVEYWCPLCRQLANTALPVPVERDHSALVTPLPLGDRQLVQWITAALAKGPVTQSSGNLTAALGKLMVDLTRSTEPLRTFSSGTPLNESIFRFVCNVVRCNLETAIMQAEVQGELNATASSPQAHTSKSCLLPLIHLSTLLVQIQSTTTSAMTLIKQQYTDLWTAVAGDWAVNEIESDSVVLHQKPVPLLMRDAATLLIQLVLSLPITEHPEVYRLLVQAMFNVVYIQSLVRISLQFSHDERAAWSSKVKPNAKPEDFESTLEVLLGRVILSLNHSGLYEDDSVADPFVPSISGRIWSPYSVECELNQHCLPYLRMAGHLRHHLYSEPLPQISKMDAGQELSSWCSMLGLTPTTVSLGASDDLQLRSHSGIHWFSNNPGQLVNGWCMELAGFSKRANTTARMLWSGSTQWFAPKLLQLPKEYHTIFTTYRNKPCSNCNSLPKDPAICLVCGTVVCSKERCCENNRKLECVQHALSCGAGVGVYLLVLSSYIVLIRGPRAAVWGSVYLDEHGEEDRDLKRGKPLYLCKERYRLLYQQWISHSFDRVGKRWILHRDQL